MRRILVATDMTEGAHEALGRACAMSRDAKSEICIVHVLPASADQDERSIVRSKLRDQIAGFPGAPGSFELDLSIRLPRGEPAEAILAEAERFKPDLIILGAHGEPRFRDVIFGTTASHVARAAKQPVLIVQTDHNLPYERLLVAIDDSSAQEILRVAANIDSATDLFVVHAHGSAGQSLFGGERLDDVRAGQEAMTRDLLAIVKDLRPGATALRIHNIVEEGEAIEVIMKAWTDVKPDLLVMGTRGRTGLPRLLRGSHAEIAMLGCTSDILIVRTHLQD